jgi:poly-gamma-glutamate synthesis protein (capsule biosynthesis protein)
MTDDIRKLRPLCDVLIVVFHKGIINTPVKLAMYEQPLSYAAIDAGADLILGHHAHILRGIEQYKGRTIFHGLGNFIFASMNTIDHGVPHLAFQFGVSSVTEFFGPAPDTLERKQTIIAKCMIESGNISRVSYLPCLINQQGQPEILKNDERGHQVFNYMEKITREAGLNARYEWERNEVLIMSDKHSR